MQIPGNPGLTIVLQEKLKPPTVLLKKTLAGKK
jgi:hypothetical protein